MELSSESEEVLEKLWIMEAEKGEKETSLSKLELRKSSREIKELSQLNLISVKDGSVRLTVKGRREARNVVRRHRLAERLLVDVLDVKEGLVDDFACKFEHVLGKEVDESICTLLGHPRICPHGNPIPPGKCCLEGKKLITSVISPLTEMEPGESGRIAYIFAKEQGSLKKLMSLGVLPGKIIKLIEKFPSYVFRVGETQVAIDERIAGSIYVRVVPRVEEALSEASPRRKRRRWRWRFRGLGSVASSRDG